MIMDFDANNYFGRDKPKKRVQLIRRLDFERGKLIPTKEDT